MPQVDPPPSEHQPTKHQRISHKPPRRNTVVRKSRAELRKKREDLVKSTGLSYERLMEYGDNWSLRGKERNAYDTIRRINMILDDDNRSAS